MVDIIMLPGIGGSGEAHWQTRWEQAEARFSRFSPASWDEPELGNWIEALERAASACERPPVLVAHSLACLLVAHWSATSRTGCAGAFLVSVPDPLGERFPAQAASFAPAPRDPLRFPSLVIASSDDPYGSVDHARLRAREWRSGFVLAGAMGHINASSGLGDWPQGRMLLEAFMAGVGRV